MTHTTRTQVLARRLTPACLHDLADVARDGAVLAKGAAYALDAGSVADVATGRLKRRLCLSLRRGAGAAASAREAVAAEPAVAGALLAPAAATRERRRGGRRLRLGAPADVYAACDAKRLPPCCLPAWCLLLVERLTRDDL